MKHYKLVEFLQISECYAPLNKHKAPLLKTFWRRFRVQQRMIKIKINSATIYRLLAWTL